MAWYNPISSLQEHVFNPIGQKLGEVGYTVYTKMTGDEDMSGVFGTATGNPNGEDNAFTVIMNRSAGAGQLAIDDPNRFVTVAGRSMVEKGGGTILAIPGDGLDLVNEIRGWTVGEKYYDGSIGDWTRTTWNNGITATEKTIGIKPMEFRDENEAFVSGIYGEVPGNAFAIASPFKAASTLTATTMPGKAAQRINIAFKNLSPLNNLTPITATTTLGKTAQVGKNTLAISGKGGWNTVDTASLAIMGDIEAQNFEQAESLVSNAKETEKKNAEKARTVVAVTTNSQPSPITPSAREEFNSAAQEGMWSNVFNFFADAYKWVKDVAVSIAEKLGLREMFNDKASETSETSVAVALKQEIIPSAAVQETAPQNKAASTPQLGMGA